MAMSSAVSKNENKNDIKKLAQMPVQCDACGHKANAKVVEISDKLFPETKYEFVVNCHNCNFKKVDEYTKYLNMKKIIISCNFTGKNDLMRRMYLETNSKVYVSDMNNNDVIEFMNDDAYVDTVETLLVRCEDMLNCIAEEHKVTTINTIKTNGMDKTVVIKQLQKMRETGEFKMTIQDDTGMSRVFPVNVVKIEGELKKEPVNEGTAVGYTTMKE